MEQRKKDRECLQAPETVPLMESLEEDDQEDEELVQDSHADEPPAKEPPAKEPPAGEPQSLPEDWNAYSIDHIKDHKVVNNKIKYLIKWKWDCVTRTEEADETLEDPTTLGLQEKQEYWKEKIKEVITISLHKKQWCRVILKTGPTITLQKNLIPKDLIQAFKNKRK